MTPHIEANKGDYAEAVLLPGDPLRARWIAETLLDNPRQVNGVRNCLGYTGTWKGKPVSVQATILANHSWKSGVPYSAMSRCDAAAQALRSA